MSPDCMLIQVGDLLLQMPSVQALHLMLWAVPHHGLRLGCYGSHVFVPWRIFSCNWRINHLQDLVLADLLLHHSSSWYITRFRLCEAFPWVLQTLKSSWMLIDYLDKRESRCRLLRCAGLGTLLIAAHGVGLWASLWAAMHFGSSTANTDVLNFPTLLRWKTVFESPSWLRMFCRLFFVDD